MTVSPLSVTALSPYNHSQAGLLSANPMKNLEEIYSLFSRGEFSFSDLSTLENGIKDQFPNLKSVSSFPQLLAFLSVYSSNGGVLIFLLEQKLVEFECLDGDRKTILEQACLQSTTQIVELILRNGAVIDRPGVDSIPIVDLTIRGKNPQKSEVLELLLNPDYKASIESSLEVALEHDERAIPMLRARGAIVPSKLIHLIFNGNAEAQKQFLFLCKAAVANIIQPDQIELIENHVFRITGVRHSGHFTQSLFSFACFVRDLVTLRYLAPHIDFEFEDSEGLSPLGVTAKKGDSVVFAELLKAGAKLDSFCSFKNGLNPLHLACHYGHAQIVETILTSTVPYVEANQQEKKRKFSDVTNVTELRLETFSGGKLFPIHLASNGGHLNVLRVLLKFGARADSLTSEGFNFTPLMGASHYGHVEVVLELLNHTKNISPESLAEFVNAQDDQKSTALIIAVNQKQSKVIPILLSFGARMEIEEFCVEDDLDFLVDCALMGALHRDQVDSLTRKMQKQQSFVVVDEAEPESLLQIFTLVAISTGKEALFLKLIDRVLPFINSCRINHKSFLHVAVTSDLESIVIGLLDRGADINLPDKDGSAPIHLAARQGVANTLLILLQRGAKFDQPRKDGFYPIHIVAENGDTLSLSYLHLFGCDVNKQTNNASGLRPLHVAIEEEESDFVEELLGRNFRSGEPQTFVNFRPTSENVRKLGVGRYGVDVEATDKKGRPPLFFATELEHVSERMYKLLLNAGASVDSVNSVTKEPCIHRALLSAKVEHIKLLLPFLVNKGIKDKDGNKLIHKSIMYKRLDLLRLLLDSGANVEDRVDNDSSFTTLYYAGYYGTYEIAEELINRKKQKDPNGLVDFINLTFDDKCTENAAQTSLERGFVRVAELLVREGAKVISSWLTKAAFKLWPIQSFTFLVGRPEISPDYVDEEGDSVLQLVAIQPKNTPSKEASLKLVLESPHASAIEKLGSNQVTPLQVVITLGDMVSFRTLIKYGASTRSISRPLPHNRQIYSALQLSIFCEKYEITSAILEHEKLVSSNQLVEFVNQEVSGRTAIHEACILGHTPTIEALFQYGANGCRADYIHLLNQLNHEAIIVAKKSDLKFTEKMGDTVSYVKNCSLVLDRIHTHWLLLTHHNKLGDGVVDPINISASSLFAVHRNNMGGLVFRIDSISKTLHPEIHDESFFKQMYLNYPTQK